TPEDLRKAHAYAYGGGIIQEMGYYPFGGKIFSHLAHYFCSGGFVLNLLPSAGNLGEYAFALGSRAAYAPRNNRHPEAGKQSVALIYPKLRRRFGKVITYADSPIAHLKVEFSFDVSQVAQGNYAPDAYHDFIGFEVAQLLMERAVAATYCLKLSDLIHEE